MEREYACACEKSVCVTDIHFLFFSDGVSGIALPTSISKQLFVFVHGEGRLHNNGSSNSTSNSTYVVSGRREEETAQPTQSNRQISTAVAYIFVGVIVVGLHGGHLLQILEHFAWLLL